MPQSTLEFSMRRMHIPEAVHKCSWWGQCGARPLYCPFLGQPMAWHAGFVVAAVSYYYPDLL